MQILKKDCITMRRAHMTACRQFPPTWPGRVSVCVCVRVSGAK